MDKFLDTYSLPVLIQEEIKILNKPLISNAIQIEIKILPSQKNPELHGFTVECYNLRKN
jgi:hypothetical protein